jgi:hypothetical protein
MELDELKLAWQAMETRVERLEAQRITGKVQRMGGPTAWELIGDVMALLLTGSFLYHYGSDWRYLIPGLILHLTGILAVATGVRQLVLLSRLDVADSVLATQKALAALATERLRVNRALLTFCPLLWPPLLIVLMRAAGGDPYKALPTVWLWANIIFGVVMVPVGVWLSRRFGDWLGDEKLRAAQGELEAIRHFEMPFEAPEGWGSDS